MKSSPIVGPEKAKGDGGGGTGGGGGDRRARLPGRRPERRRRRRSALELHEAEHQDRSVPRPTRDGDGGLATPTSTGPRVDLNRGNWSTSLPYAGPAAVPEPARRRRRRHRPRRRRDDAARGVRDVGGPALRQPLHGRSTTAPASRRRPPRRLRPPRLRLTPAAIYGSAPSMRFLDANRDQHGLRGRAPRARLQPRRCRRRRRVHLPGLQRRQRARRQRARRRRRRPHQLRRAARPDDPRATGRACTKPRRPTPRGSPTTTTEFMIPDTDGDGVRRRPRRPGPRQLRQHRRAEPLGRPGPALIEPSAVRSGQPAQPVPAGHGRCRSRTATRRPLTTQLSRRPACCTRRSATARRRSTATGDADPTSTTSRTSSLRGRGCTVHRDLQPRPAGQRLVARRSSAPSA